VFIVEAVTFGMGIAGLVGSGIPGSTNGVRSDACLDSEAPSKLGFTYRREMEKQQHEKLLLDNLRNVSIIFLDSYYSLLCCCYYLDCCRI
jgi:hypothetical protein